MELGYKYPTLVQVFCHNTNYTTFLMLTRFPTDPMKRGDNAIPYLDETLCMCQEGVACWVCSTYKFSPALEPDVDRVFQVILDEDESEEDACNGVIVRGNQYRLEVLDTFDPRTRYPGQHIVTFDCLDPYVMFNVGEAEEFYSLFEGRMYMDGSKIVASWDAFDIDYFPVPVTSSLQLVNATSIVITFNQPFKYCTRDIAGPCFSLFFKLLHKGMASALYLRKQNVKFLDTMYMLTFDGDLLPLPSSVCSPRPTTPSQSICI